MKELIYTMEIDVTLCILNDAKWLLERLYKFCGVPVPNNIEAEWIKFTLAVDKFDIGGYEFYVSLHHDTGARVLILNNNDRPAEWRVNDIKEFEWNLIKEIEDYEEYLITQAENQAEEYPQ